MRFGRMLTGLALAGALVLGPIPGARADSPADRLADADQPILDKLGRTDVLRPGDGSGSDDSDEPGRDQQPEGPLSGHDSPLSGLVTDPSSPPDKPDSSETSETSETSEKEATPGQPDEQTLPKQHASSSGMHPRVLRDRDAAHRTVTLITGDRVRVKYGGKRSPRVSVEPGPGRADVDFDIDRDGGAVTVLPQDARRLVETGRLDSRLFDVTGLIRQRYHDGASEHLPILVERESPTMSPLSPAARAQAHPPFGPLRLSSLGMAATELPKQQLGEFWEPLQRTAETTVDRAATPKGATSLVDSTSAAGQTARREPDGDLLGVRTMDAPRVWRALAIEPSAVRKVWLDGRVRAMDGPTGSQAAPVAPTREAVDDHLQHIGAPDAWKHGLTGEGARVAVLDSGIDRRHPDLAGRVAATKDFVGGGVGDRMGHGTHVSSVVAGSGEASDGTYRGVAPDARLLVGRVLDGQGSGTESEAIAGMEWAVRRGADVLNVSLGNDKGSDGSDPLSRAANRLGRRALVVAAAGNGGPERHTISAPGAAARALTVAAVHGDGETADFSARGPRLGGNGDNRGEVDKPDIAAPGVNVVGARATGTEAGPVVSRRYVELTGTSMAVPYVSGAAAILAQEHPDWTPGRLKRALMEAAQPRPGSPADDPEQGAGELDVARLAHRAGDAERASGRRRVPTGRSGWAVRRPRMRSGRGDQ